MCWEMPAENFMIREICENINRELNMRKAGNKFCVEPEM